jgi:type IV pilus biogenesis protein PilP
MLSNDLSKPKTTRATKIVAVIGVAVILAISGFILFWDGSSPLPLSPSAATNKQQPLPVPEAGTALAETAAVTNTGVTVTQGDYLNAPTDLGRLTQLQSDLEEAKLTVAIAEQKARATELGVTIPGSEAMPQIVAMPGAAVAPADLNAAPISPAVAQDRVLSVQGLGGQIIATVETAGGIQTVKVGDTFGFGQVERISVAGVTIRKGDQTRLISVED